MKSKISEPTRLTTTVSGLTMNSSEGDGINPWGLFPSNSFSMAPSNSIRSYKCRICSFVFCISRSSRPQAVVILQRFGTNNHSDSILGKSPDNCCSTRAAPVRRREASFRVALSGVSWSGSNLTLFSSQASLMLLICRQLWMSCSWAICLARLLNKSMTCKRRHWTWVFQNCATGSCEGFNRFNVESSISQQSWFWASAHIFQVTYWRESHSMGGLFRKSGGMKVLNLASKSVWNVKSTPWHPGFHNEWMFLLSHNQCNQKIHVRMLNHISYIQFKLFLHHSINLDDRYGFPSHICNFQGFTSYSHPAWGRARPIPRYRPPHQ